ncbi:spore germination protein [Neobacillus cucumis]|uniref:spore germination protein n=1 Tax=Neobacillus cucumis TaxID=1740721 RepID=UPI003558D3EF
MNSNTVLVRFRIKGQKHILEKIKKGDFSNTDIAIMHIKGIANDNTLSEVANLFPPLTSLNPFIISLLIFGGNILF